MWYYAWRFACGRRNSSWYNGKYRFGIYRFSGSIHRPHNTEVDQMKLKDIIIATVAGIVMGLALFSDTLLNAGVI